MAGYKGEGLLRLEVGYYDAPDVRSASQILDRLGNAFTQEMRSNGFAYQLQIARIEIASLKAYLDIVGAFDDLWQQREILGRFVEAVALAVQTALSGGSEISPAIRNLLLTMSAPVKNGRADHARLSVHGDNNTIVYIENANAIELDRLLSPPRAGRQVAYERAGRPREIREYQGTAPTRTVGVGYRDALDLESNVALKSPPYQTGSAGRDPEADELRRHPDRGRRANASLHFLDDAWVARPTGEGGIILPIDAGSLDLSALEVGGKYHAEGEVRYQANTPNRFRLLRIYPV